MQCVVTVFIVSQNNVQSYIFIKILDFAHGVCSKTNGSTESSEKSGLDMKSDDQQSTMNVRDVYLAQNPINIQVNGQAITCKFR